MIPQGPTLATGAPLLGPWRTTLLPAAPRGNALGLAPSGSHGLVTMPQASLMRPATPVAQVGGGPQPIASYQAVPRPACSTPAQIGPSGARLVVPQGQRPVLHVQVHSAPPDASARLAGLLPHIDKCRAQPNLRSEAYQSFLRALVDWGVLDGLPTDESRNVRVGLPFCGQCGEAWFLLPFLSENLIDSGAAAAISIHGCDVTAEPQAFWWPAWREWAEQSFGGRISLECHQQDLVSAPLAASDFILGVHPVVLEGAQSTSGGAASSMDIRVKMKAASPWHSIMANVLRGLAPGGRAVFATFYMSEARAAEQIIASLGLGCEIRENPYYVNHPADAMATQLRFAVIVKDS